MGGIINYTATIFKEPNPINENLYKAFKESLDNNQYYSIVKNENFYSKFKRHFNMIIIGISGIALSYVLKLIFGDSIDTLFDWISIPSVILLFLGFIFLLLEGSSYSDYLNKSNAYFLRMKYAILKSSSYFEFNEIFYTIFSYDYDADFKKWKKEYFKQAGKK